VLSADIAKWSNIWLKDNMTTADKTTASRYITDFNTSSKCKSCRFQQQRSGNGFVPGWQDLHIDERLSALIAHCL
jgi:hypothetical protein